MNAPGEANGPAARVDGMSAARLMARALESPVPPVPSAHWEPPDAAVLTAQLAGYEVLALIGRGGMGAVYRARQRSLDRLVAIKVLPLEASADELFAARFESEARLLARLQHPNIVAVYDSGAAVGGHLYLVMELVEGSDLAQMIRAGKLPSLQSLEIVARVCDALQYAHQRGIIHRDIKPSNILFSTDGVVKVADFGLAKLHDTADSTANPQTLTGTVMGTPEYMAPEQRLGGAVDQRVDIYSLGVLFYEMLTGQIPRGAWEPPSKYSDVDQRVDSVVTRALQNEPAKRYQAAGEVRSAVEGIRDTKARPLWKRALLFDLGWPGRLGMILLICVIILGALLPTAALVRRKYFPTPAPETQKVKVTPTDVLATLDIAKEKLSGEWSWLEGKAGGVLTHAISPGGVPKRVRLPLAAPDQAYELSFEFMLAQGNSDGGLVFPIGGSRTGLLLNLQRVSGLGLVHGRIWNDNETTTRANIPQQQWHTMTLTVRPGADRAGVVITLNGRPFIQWQGKAGDLTLYEAAADGWAMPGAPGQFGVASYGGGFSMRNAHFTALKK